MPRSTMPATRGHRRRTRRRMRTAGATRSVSQACPVFSQTLRHPPRTPRPIATAAAMTHVLSPDGAGGLVMRAESGGVTTPGTTIDLGVVVWDGLTGTAIGDAGIREYGKSATDPTVPTPADGDGYYNTALNMRMTYDGSRSKWLSERTAELWFGRSGNTGAGAYYRGRQGIARTRRPSAATQRTMARSFRSPTRATIQTQRRFRSRRTE